VTQLIATADKSWHGVQLGQSDWGEDSHSIAFTARMRKEEMTVHLMLNAFLEPLEFELPPIAGTWRRWIDTSL
jgi:isoamylase